MPKPSMRGLSAGKTIPCAASAVRRQSFTPHENFLAPVFIDPNASLCRFLPVGMPPFLSGSRPQSAIPKPPSESEATCSHRSFFCRPFWRSPSPHHKCVFSQPAVLTRAPSRRQSFYKAQWQFQGTKVIQGTKVTAPNPTSSPQQKITERTRAPLNPFPINTLPLG
jgi:hypothetical protein